MSEYSVAVGAAHMIEDFIRIHVAPKAKIFDAGFVDIVGWILTDPKAEHLLTRLIEDIIGEEGDGCIAAPMAIDDLVRRILALGRQLRGGPVSI